MKFFTIQRAKFLILLLLLLFVVSTSNFNFKRLPFYFVELSAKAESTPIEDKKIYELNFNSLEETEKYLTSDGRDIDDFPEEISEINGQRVKITGNLLIPSEAYYFDSPLDDFAVSKNAYGCPCCSWGPPPTIFNVVMVSMKEGHKVKPPFSQLIEVTGTFIAKKEYYTDEEGGKQLAALFFIEEAEAKKKEKSFLQSIF